MNTRISITAGIVGISAMAIVGFKAMGPVNQTADGATRTPLTEQSVMGIIYQQRAAEYRALCFQAYNVGMERIDNALDHKKRKEKLAVITDLDETALDNSGYAVRCYNEGHGYTSDSWAKWCADAVADSVPGSVSFFKYADSYDVQIFYVSNRSSTALAKTMENMKRLGFPQVTEEHFKLKTTANSKEERRREIAKTYKIVALFGDNLLDMDAAFDDAPEKKRTTAADSLRMVWGNKYIVLPNATYGDWETVLYRQYKERHPNEKIVPQDSIYVIRAASMKQY